MTSIQSLTHPDNLVRNGESSARSRDPLPRLLLQIIARAEGPVVVERATSRPWASALFQGRRHVIMLRLTGVDAAERRDRFMEGIEEAEWSLGSHFVADLTVDMMLTTDQGEQIELSALTIEDW